MALNVVSSDRLSTNVKTSNLATDLSAVVGTRKNLLYNGSMEIAQRGTSFASIGSPGTYHLDRWRSTFTLATGRYTASQDSSGPAGFAKSLKIDVTTAEASLGASSAAGCVQMLEGQDLQQLQKGTATAKSVTLSFWVKSTTTGTYVVELQDSQNNRILCKQYTISAANTWEKKTLTFAGDTTGALTADNAGRLYVQFFLAAGTNYTSGTLGANWAASVAANRMVGQTNLFSSTDNDWYVTGIQLEVGDTATEFEHTSYGDELLRCLRYCWVQGKDQTYTNFAEGTITSSTGWEGIVHMPVPMRAKPTTTFAGTTRVWDASSATNTSATGTDSGSGGKDVVRMTATCSGASFNIGRSALFGASNDATASVTHSAEL